ncbi:MAG: hypothetical protein GY862_24710 [Gammaproteobacteria bacterium]|nr:hypothetical protein [Gammaproteobacteria bacterium]
MKTYYVMGLSLFALLMSGFNSLYARPAEGSCAGYEFPIEGDEVDSTKPVWALRNGVILYDSATGSNRKPGTLQFGERLYPKKISSGADSGRILVRKSSQRWNDSAGWVDRHEVLCRIEPLKTQKSPDQKAFINTSEGRGVPAYPGYGTKKCSSCPKLGRFQLYFIFAKDPDNKRYLVSQEFNLTVAAGHPLTGWVDEKFIIRWNTTLQVRPKENIKILWAEPEKRGQTKEEYTLFKGGKAWFKMPYHMPLLGKVKKNGEQYYKVAAPGVGMSAIESFGRITGIIETIMKFKNMDVFFLIDGTLSLKPYIEQAKSMAINTVNLFKDDPNYAGISFRFGFRIYRDVYAGNDGIGELSALTGDCTPVFAGDDSSALPKAPRESRLPDREGYNASHARQFNRVLSPVQASTHIISKDDGFPEALFAGLNQAVRDISSCPGHRKMLFVIGDAGDNLYDVPSRIVRNLKKKFPNKPVVFFVQAPGTANGCSEQDEKQCSAKSCTKACAYRRFQRQADRVLKNLYGSDYRNNRLSMQREQDFAKIIEKSLAGYGRTDIPVDFVRRLRNGDAVHDAVEALLKRYPQKGDLPVLNLRLLAETACKRMSKKECREGVNHNVHFFNISIDKYKDKMVEEMWMKEADFDKWKVILAKLRRISGGFKKQKGQFVHALLSQIQMLLGTPPLGELKEIRQQLADRQESLPFREDSPLLQYKPDEIMRIRDECEFNRLINWIDSIAGILNKVYSSPTKKITVQSDLFPSDCGFISEKGKNIKRIKVTNISPFHEGDDAYSYRQNLTDNKNDDRPIYIVPLEFLP